MTSIGIIGSEGRMGVALAAAISEAGQRSCGVDRGGNVAKLAAGADGKFGFASLRGGTVAGDHDVIFAGPEEMITLSHRAENRMIFARGAVRAALWLMNQKPDRYTMPQVLGLSEG